MTEAWIVPTVDDLSAYLAEAAMAALRTAALGVGQTDPFLEHMPSIVATVRAYIAGCDTNVLSATANSIPRSLKNVTCLMIIEAMQGRVPGLNLTDGQKDSLKYGREMLKEVASCDIPVTAPTDPAESTAQIGPIAYVVNYTELTAKPSQTAGLF